MLYALDAGRRFMRELGIVTVVLAWAETDMLFHARNAFASGGCLPTGKCYQIELRGKSLLA